MNEPERLDLRIHPHAGGKALATSGWDVGAQGWSVGSRRMDGDQRDSVVERPAMIFYDYVWIVFVAFKLVSWGAS